MRLIQSKILNDFLSFFKKPDHITTAQIQALPALLLLRERLNGYFELIEQAAGKPHDHPPGMQVTSDQSLPDYLHAVFDAVNTALASSMLNVQLTQAWKHILCELLVTIPYRGEHIESASRIKADLDSHADLLASSRQVKKLLIDYCHSLCDDQDEMQQYLVSTVAKLQGIYQEISQAKDKYFSRPSSAARINDTFQQGLLELNASMQAHNDLQTLKHNISAVVTAIQEKVIKEIESEDSEIKILETKIAGMSDKIKSLQTHTRDLENTIRKKHLEAITDSLTGLLNRAAYVQALEKAWMNWQHHQTPATMLVCDIDHFKMVNDRHGHAAGDRVLQSIAGKLKASVPDEGIVARFGGEEFVILLNGKTIQEGEKIAEQIRQLIADTDFTYKKNALYVTISCGIASFAPGDTATTLFERADKALYKAKRNGRDRVETLKVA